MGQQINAGELPTAPPILLVEDNEIILQILSSTLENAGWETQRARSAEEAIAFIESGAQICMALIDVGLPGMSGLELARWLKRNRPTPFVMLTSHDDDDSIKAAIAEGALSYLLKPVDATKLVPVVRVAMARHEEHCRLQATLDADRSASIAIGILMRSHDISEKRAFNLIREEARSRRKKVIDVATQIIKESSRSS